MSKNIAVIVVVALLFCFSGKAYCFSMNDLKNAAQTAASTAQQAAANKASKGTSSTTTTNANANTAQQTPSGVTDNAPTGTSNNNTQTAAPLAANNAPPVATTSLPPAVTNTPVNIQDNGVFYTAETTSPTEKRNGPFTVFDIPLNASVQEVFSVLEKKGIDYRYGRFNDENQKKQFINGGLRDLVSRSYDNKGISGVSKEAALRVVDEGKIKFYPFTYKNRQYWLYPQSLGALLNSDLKPVFDKYYNIYNSQTMIELRDASLSEDMKSQGVVKAYILFGSVGQEEPKSYLISLQFSWQTFNPKLAAILNKKYGLPKAYPYIFANQEGWPSEIVGRINAAFAYLKSKSASYEEKGQNEFIYKIPRFLAINDSEALDQISRPLMTMYNAQNTGGYEGESFERCIFEWNPGDVKILADFVVWPLQPQLVLQPSYVDYIYFPLATKISDGVEELINASKQMGETAKNKAEQSF